MRKIGIVGIAVSLAGLVALTATTRVAADGHDDDSYRCNNQTLTSTTIHGNVVVPPGAFCDLVGSRITGSVEIQRSGGLSLDAASSVDRNVIDGRDAQVVLFNGSTVGGSIWCSKCSAADLHDSTVWGSLYDNGLTFGADLTNSQIHGSLSISHSQDGGFGFSFTGNTIGEDFSFADNTGSSTMSGNTIEDELNCRGNTPPPAGGGNTAAEKEGQCAGL
ncbi:MAG TPA: hypothetical protein VNY76_09235 [Candidatus Acidoferrales bacterium]|nr:hypothetical protein [Candidatus Acidoferrales bacterium]